MAKVIQKSRISTGDGNRPAVVLSAILNFRGNPLAGEIGGRTVISLAKEEIKNQSREAFVVFEKNGGRVQCDTD